jgi:hypothetical protein
MDKMLSLYRSEVAKRTQQTIPEFSADAVHTASILALLETPGGSGAVGTGVVCITNPDPTAKRTLRMIERAGLRPGKYLLWNFFASYESVTADRERWRVETHKLIEILPNLKVVLVFGNNAWLGMRDVELPQGVFLIGAPHPSNLAVNSDKLAEGKIKRAWQRAKNFI